MAEKSRWDEFQSDNQDYTIEDIGREFVFYFPVSKAKRSFTLKPKQTVEEFLFHFLKKNFNGFTVMSAPSFGVWHDGSMFHFDRCRRYEVSFLGKDKIPMLIKVLAVLAKSTGEKCIYIGAGQYRALVFPKGFLFGIYDTKP